MIDFLKDKLSKVKVPKSTIDPNHSKELSTYTMFISADLKDNLQKKGK